MVKVDKINASTIIRNSISHPERIEVLNDLTIKLNDFNNKGILSGVVYVPLSNLLNFFLNDVFAAMKMTVVINAEYKEDEKELTIDLSGDDMGVLIGKRGQTLDSLQYLVSLIVNKDSTDYIRVKVDTENYRKRRQDTLENLAKNIAFKVKRTKRTVSLEPMNPYERRIIHSALQNDKFVTTHSEGEEPFRHVVVTMKR